MKPYIINTGYFSSLKLSKITFSLERIGRIGFIYHNTKCAHFSIKYTENNSPNLLALTNKLSNYIKHCCVKKYTEDEDIVGDMTEIFLLL